MDRRTLLASVASGLTVGTAGCLDGFETSSAWEQPPLVEDRPDAVYLPAGEEGMGRYGTVTADDVRVALLYTYPHRFWVVTGDTDQRHEVDDADVMHLMAAVWDPDTGLTVPTEVSGSIRQDGERIADYQLWPMLSQQMGFHYGDNVILDGNGEYTIDLQLDPTTARTTGAAAGILEQSTSTTIDVEYESRDVLDLPIERFEEDRWGEADAAPLMSASMDDAPPALRAPEAASLPGDTYDLGSTGDARVLATVLDDGPVEGGPYLAVSPRTPYHRLALPRMALSAAVVRDGQVVAERRLLETLDPTLGYHYGDPLDLRAGDEVQVRIDAPPQVARHAGYETAFFGMEPLSFTVGE